MNDNFNIDVNQLNPLSFNTSSSEIEEAGAAANAEEELQQEQALETGVQNQEKNEAYATGGRNRPDQPTSDDGTLDYLQSTPDEQLPEGYKKSDEEKNLGEAAGDMIKGAALDTYENVVTAIPRFYDMATGTMEREGETYRPWGMMYDAENNIDYNPITQETQIGKLGRDVLSAVGTTAAVAGIIALGAVTAKAVGLSLPVIGFLTLAGGATRARTALGLFARGATWLGGRGMIADGIDMKSQDANISQSIGDTKFMQSAVKMFPFLMNPIATNDTDHPMVKTMKNVLEGGLLQGGIGGLFGVMSKGKGAQNAIDGAATKPPKQVHYADDTEQIVAEKFAADAGKAKQYQAEAAEELLRREVGEAYFRKSKGTSTFEDLAPDDQQALMIERYMKNPEKYTGWSPPNELAEDRGLRKIVEMNASQNKQVTDAGMEQLDIPGMGGFKGKGTVADAQQGNPISSNTVTNIAEQVSTMRHTIDGEWGSTDALATPAQILRSNKVADITGEELNDMVSQMLEKERWGRVIAEIKEEGGNVRDTFTEAFQKHREMIEGRNITDLSVEDFWKPLDDQLTMRTGGPDSRDAWYMKNVVVADLNNASLFKNMRDLGITARETGSVLDPFDIDGPAAQVLDKLEYGLFNVKKSRMLWSQMGKDLQNEMPQEQWKAMMEKRLLDMRLETKNQVSLMRELAMKSDSAELSETLMEIFSWSNNIRNWEDVTEVFRKRLRGGTLNGRKYDSMILQELQGVMVHSVLSGPKTPVRAMMGTATATFLKPMSEVIGGVSMLDKTQIREGMAGLSGAVGAIPDAWKLFKRNLHSYWTGDLSTIKTRYGDLSKRDQSWKAMGEWMMEHGTDGDKAAYLWGNFARGLNDNSFLTFNSRILGAMDDSFGYIMARSRSKVRAMQDSIEAQRLGRTPEVTPELMKAFEARYMSEFIDEGTGRIKAGVDIALDHAAKEATLTRDLSGWSESFANLFSSNPWTKPFFLFARTGINGVKLSLSHMPAFKYMLKEERRILNATMEQADLGQLADLGIANSKDLMNAKALQRGRTIIGGSVITMAAQKVMAGELTGNGSADRGVREAQRMGDWQPRSIKINGKWVSYDSFEPFNTILAYVADTADVLELMGEEWVEDKFQKAALALVGSGVTKTYLSGLTQIVDLLSGEPGQIELMGAALVNNTVPLGGLRNEIGKVVSPHMKELNREFDDQIRNRNMTTELVANEPIPIKYDILNGTPIRNWNFPTRLFNAFSPISINPDYSPGRTLLFNSGYDMRTIALRPEGVDLSDEPELRSMYQQAMGKEGIEEELNRLAEDPRAIESLEQMEEDRDNNRKGKEPDTYWVNERIQNIFERASHNAWLNIRQSPRAQLLIQQKKLIQSSQAAQRAGQYELSNQYYEQLQELKQMIK